MKEKMKIRIKLLMLLFLCGGYACTDDNSVLPVVKSEGSGVYTDSLGREYSWVRYGNLEWMTKNLDINIETEDEGKNTGCEVSREESRNPIDKELEIKNNYETFGNLYTYEAALSVVPEGWRIPTDEDWKSLEKYVGMSEHTLNLLGWRGEDVGNLLQKKDNCEMNLRLGGMGEYDGYGNFIPYFLYIYGFYWTATTDEVRDDFNYCRQISYMSGKIARTAIDKGKMLSVRCVRDAK